ncbi:MAG: methyltransferase domain-containing protein, partial [Planctomycetota bacterium]
MSFETPEQNLPENNSSSEESAEDHSERLTLSPEYMAEQTALPPEKWSDEFNDYIAQKIKEKAEDEAKETPPEEWHESTYQRHLKSLNLTAEKLQDKKVLDIGCGEEGYFVKSLIDEGVTDDVYGLDMRKVEDPDDRYKRHFIQGDMLQEIPVKDCDLAVSVGAMTVTKFSESKSSIRTMIKNTLGAVKPGGEARIFPLQKASRQDEYV